MIHNAKTRGKTVSPVVTQQWLRDKCEQQQGKSFYTGITLQHDKPYYKAAFRASLED
jgi:hypothetical protein